MNKHKKIIRIILVAGIILISILIFLSYLDMCKKEKKVESGYILHEWGVLLGDSARTIPLENYQVHAAKPIIYIYSNDSFNLSLSVDFENGEAMEVWPYIPIGKKISWNNFEISADCNTTLFPEQQWDMKEIYELGNYVVDNANCITYKNTTSKILFYNGKIDFGNAITGYYVDLGDKKQITLTNNLNQNISDIYINYKEHFVDYSYGLGVSSTNVTLGILKIDKLNAGETKTFDINIYDYSEIPVAWTNQGKEFKQKLINEGLYTNEADKFMSAWENTFFGMSYGYGYYSNIDYKNGMNIIYILPKEKYNELFRLETSIEPKEIKRISVVYSPIEESVPMTGTTSITSSSTKSEEGCEDYINQIKIYCNPFLSSYNKELCNMAEKNYGDNNCCHSKS